MDEKQLREIIEPYLCRQCTELLDRLTKEILSISPWKKFSEQKPDAGRNVFVKDFSLFYIINNILEDNIEYIIDVTPKSEWMYAPE